MAIAMGWIFRDPHLPYCCTTGVQPLTGRGHHAQQSQFHQQIDLALERVLKKLNHNHTSKKQVTRLPSYRHFF